jgi:hypothetical protein
MWTKIVTITGFLPWQVLPSRRQAGSSDVYTNHKANYHPTFSVEPSETMTETKSCPAPQRSTRMIDNSFSPFFLPVILVRDVAIFHDNYPMLSVWMSLTASEVSANNNPRPYKVRQDKLSKGRGIRFSAQFSSTKTCEHPSGVLRT